MKIGVLESKDDDFIKDVLSRLGGFDTEFISLREQLVPINSDYRVIIDRSSFYNRYLRETVKYLSLNGVYIINNPFACDATNKIMEMKLCSMIGIACPKTIILPKIGEEDEPEVKEPDWDKISGQMAFPCILKPFDGYAWDSVYRIGSMDELKNLYDVMKRKHVLLLQELVKYRDYYRVFCINKRHVLFIKWEPSPGGMGKYIYSDLEPIKHMIDQLTEWTIELHQRLDLDLNVVEWCIDEKGNPVMIEAFNDIPDIPKKQLPESYYYWIVEKMAECVKEKFNSNETNRSILMAGVSAKTFIRELVNNI